DIWSWFVEERSDLSEFGPRLEALEAACLDVGRDPATTGGPRASPWSRPCSPALPRCLAYPSAVRRRRSRLVFGRFRLVASTTSRSYCGRRHSKRSRPWARSLRCSDDIAHG